MPSVSHGLCLSLALLRGGHPRTQLNYERSRLRPRAAPVRASLRRQLSAECCETSCERLLCVSFSIYRLLLNASRLLRLTCDASTFAECSEASRPHLPRSSRDRCCCCWGARLSLHALSSQARHWLEVRTIMFWTLTIFINELHLSNLRDSCDFWKLLQHRVSSTTGHQRSLKGRRMAQYSAPLHLWRLSLHQDSTFFCCGGFCQSCGKIRLGHLKPSNDSCALSLLRSSRVRLPPQCIVRIFIQLQSSQLAARSLKSVCNSAILPFELRAISAVFMSLKH